jgi:acetylornithine deacetylase
MPLSDPELLARLVAFDSTSRNSNLPIADFLCTYLDLPGVRLARDVSAQGDKANVVAWIGPAPAAGRRGLVLSGHMDVVPADEPGWRHDPFTLADEGDRYLGRGACDMKGFLALAANLAAELGRDAAAAGRLSAPLVLVFTYDEEVGTLGARHLVETFAPARDLPARAIIGEPTSLAVARAHKGHLKLAITLHGRSAHSGYPHLGINAIEPAGEVIRALARLRRELASEAGPHAALFPEVPFVPLNVGTVAGGSAINVVPERCRLGVGLRPLPETDVAALVERVRRAAVEAALAGRDGTLPPGPEPDAAEAPLAGRDRTRAPGPAAAAAALAGRDRLDAWEPEIEILSDSPALLLADDAPLCRYLCTLVGQPAGGSVSFATDAGWLQRLGIECAIFGPGSIETAHRPNEWIPKRELAAARTYLAAAIRYFCGEAAAGVERAPGAWRVPGP